MKRSAVGVLFRASGQQRCRGSDISAQPEEQGQVEQDQHDSADDVLDPVLIGEDAGDRRTHSEGERDSGPDPAEEVAGLLVAALLVAGLLGDGQKHKERRTEENERRISKRVHKDAS